VFKVGTNPAGRKFAAVHLTLSVALPAVGGGGSGTAATTSAPSDAGAAAAARATSSGATLPPSPDGRIVQWEVVVCTAAADSAAREPACAAVAAAAVGLLEGLVLPWLRRVEDAEADQDALDEEDRARGGPPAAQRQGGLGSGPRCRRCSCSSRSPSMRR